MRFALTLLLVVAASATARAEEDVATSLRFARHGEPVATLRLDALREAFAAKTLAVHEPYEDREVAFRALPLAAVLDRVFTPSWREEEELLFTCRDGYQPTVPVQRALDHDAWIAFARPGADFTIDKLESGRRQEVSLAPFYLVWENLEDDVVRAEGDYGWPYQLVAIDLIRAADRFPKMTPPASAPPLAHEGYTAFRMYCTRCHPVNGEGGSIGPELNAPGREVGVRDEAWLRRWIDDPSQFAPNARMPALDRGLPDRAQTLDALIAYLRAMAGTNATTDPRTEDAKGQARTPHGG